MNVGWICVLFRESRSAGKPATAIEIAAVEDIVGMRFPPEYDEFSRISSTFEEAIELINGDSDLIY
jgi:hypothetical protein